MVVASSIRFDVGNPDLKGGSRRAEKRDKLMMMMMMKVANLGQAGPGAGQDQTRR